MSAVLARVLFAFMAIGPATPAVAAEPAPTAEIVLDGVAFSAEHGGLRLIDGWGRGSRSEPFVLVEEITDDGPAVLTVRNTATLFGRGVAGLGGVGFVLRKIVTNRTERTWTVFEMELRQRLVQPSDYWDGLSFAQADDRSAYVTSDRFATAELADEPVDRLAFSEASVAPGETVVLQLAITDHSPISPFFLIQRRVVPLAGTPPPARPPALAAHPPTPSEVPCAC